MNDGSYSYLGVQDKEDNGIIAAMADLVIGISEQEASRNFADVLAHVRAGAEVVIESGKLPVAILRPLRPEAIV
jgi:formaldehyde-activating enzyme involved in methanogenesis